MKFYKEVPENDLKWHWIVQDETVFLCRAEGEDWESSSLTIEDIKNYVSWGFLVEITKEKAENITGRLLA